MTEKPERVMLAVQGSMADLNRKGMVWQPKWDGNRGKAVYENGRVQIINRRGFDWAPYLPELEDGFLLLAKNTGAESFVMDGEIVHFKDGKSNLYLSNKRCATRNIKMIRLLHRRTIPLTFMAFDLMEWDGIRLENEPWHYRCSELKRFLPAVGPTRIKHTPTYEDADLCWQESVVKRGEEGLMAKNPLSLYVYDRSPEWVKVKPSERGIFNVCGYTRGTGRRGSTFGALIVMDDSGNLRGRVGGGFSDEVLKKILHVLCQAEPIAKPFTEADVGKPYTAVKTPLKLEVAYHTLNGSGKLREPRMTKWWTE